MALDPRTSVSDLVRALPPRQVTLARRALVLGLVALAAAYLRGAGPMRLLDGVDLAIHETGHLVFAPFGPFLGALGGTLLQLLLPMAFVASFLRRGERYAAAVTAGWVAQNLWHIAPYVADARAQALPLVGGGEHDWAYLLGEMGWLPLDVAIGETIRAVGICVFAMAMLLAWLEAAPAAGGQAPGAEGAPS